MTNSDMLKLFPFEYVGTGYFRRKGEPKGEPADTLHGIKAVLEAMHIAYEAGLEEGKKS